MCLGRLPKVLEWVVTMRADLPLEVVVCARYQEDEGVLRQLKRGGRDLLMNGWRQAAVQGNVTQGSLSQGIAPSRYPCASHRPR